MNSKIYTGLMLFICASWKYNERCVEFEAYVTEYYVTGDYRYIHGHGMFYIVLSWVYSKIIR